MSRCARLNVQHPAFNDLDARSAQVLTQAAVKARAVQQVLDILRMLLTVPRHLSLGRQCPLRQRLFQPGATQGFQHPQGNPFECRKASPFADQRHWVTQPAQAQRSSRTGRPGTEDQQRVHGPIRRSGPR